MHTAVALDPADVLQRADRAWFDLDTDIPRAAQAARTALAQAEALGDERIAAYALCVLAWHGGSSNQDLETALQQARRAERAILQMGEASLLPRLHCALALVFRGFDDRAARFEHLEKMRQASIAVGDTWHELVALHDIGLDFDKPELLERALERAETLPNPGALIIAILIRSADNLRKGGDLLPAVARAERASALAAQIGAALWQGQSLRMLALCHADAGRPAEARAALQQLELITAVPLTVRLLTRAEVQRKLGARQDAIDAYRTLLSRESDSLGTRTAHLSAARDLAPLLAEAGLWQQAYECQLRYETLRARIHEDDNARRLHGLEVQHRIALQHQQMLQEQQKNEALARHVTELENLNRAVRELSVRDALTGLYNRRHADTELARMLARVVPDGPDFSLALLDVDHFKLVNDRYGHALGDKVLRRIAELSQGELRDADLQARFGGEEFLLLLPDTHAEQSGAACERIRGVIAAHDWSAIAAGLSVTVSIGVAQAVPGQGAEALLAQADANLYAAKRGGRNRVVLA